ncbi:hypothetical protein GCM10027289_05310 [Tsukamurella serpentis]
MSRTRIIAAIVIAVIAAVAACWWGFTRGDRTPPPGLSVSLDLAKTPDGAVPGEFGPGLPTMVSPAAPTDPGSRMRVAGGRLVFVPTAAESAAAYLSTPDLRRPITEIGARFTFLPPVKGGDPAPKGNAGAVALIVSSKVENRIPQPVTPLPVHLVINAINWNFAVQPTDPTAPLVVLAAGAFKTQLREDGKQSYEARVKLDGSTAELTLPDGSQRIITDDRISTWRGSFGTFELYSNHAAADTRGAFDKVWASAGG